MEQIPESSNEVLFERYPGALDIPSETEIRSAITAMVVQQKKGKLYRWVVVVGEGVCSLQSLSISYVVTTTRIGMASMLLE